MKIIGVNYESSQKIYWYKSAEGVAIGDKVLINSQSSDRPTYHLLTVVNIHNPQDPHCPAVPPKATRWVVGKVDTSQYDWEMSKGLKKEQILKAVQDLKAEIDEVEMLEFYALKNPKMAKLLAELKTLDSPTI